MTTHTQAGEKISVKSEYVYIECCMCGDIERVPEWVAREANGTWTCDVCFKLRMTDGI